jgi:hypothetical protein
LKKVSIFQVEEAEQLLYIENSLSLHPRRSKFIAMMLSS